MSSSSAGQSTTASSTQSVRAKTDPAWNHCTEGVDSKGKKILKCLYCAKEIKGGGINRMKFHLAKRKGEVQACSKVPYDVRYQIEEYLKESEGKKNKEPSKDQWEENPYAHSTTPFEGDTPETEEIQGQKFSAKGKRKASGSIEKIIAPRTTPGAQPSIRSALAGKDAIHRADLAIARFFYDNCIPLNAVNSIYFQSMLNAVAAIGPGYKAPTYHAIRTKLLHDMKKEVQLLIDACRNTWEDTGCTIMADGWQDQKNRQLINFLVYCPNGITFIKSVDASDIVKDAPTLCKLFEDMVEFVGASNVVHLVTDNAANYKAAGRLLNEKYPSIYWSPCAAHCLNLILADIGKMELVSSLARRASMITKFIYNHAFLLAWLRKREGWTEIIRPGPTRFATIFIALKSIHQHKHDLMALVTSKTYIDSRYSKDQKAKDVVAIILNEKFWNDCAIVTQIVAPLIRVLRIVDADERPSLGYVYDAMYRARKAIKNIFMNKKTLYKPYTRIIKHRWDRQLRQKVHAAAYLLNPVFAYDKKNFSVKPEVQQGFLEVLEARIKSNKTGFLKESMLYRERRESFSGELAFEASKNMRPGKNFISFELLVAFCYLNHD